MGMPKTIAYPSMPEPTTEDVSWPELHRVRRAIVVVDVVESVRLMQVDEADFIDRWRRFVHEVRDDLLPRFGGRMVKSLGDGLLIELASAPAAIAMTEQLRQLSHRMNIERQASEWIVLRAGAHVGEIVEDVSDIYGACVNITSRIAGLAQPDTLVVSAEFRDEIVEGLDARLRDLGPCYFKHLSEPVHCFEVLQDTGATAHRTGLPGASPLRPTLAILPLAAMFGTSQAFAEGAVFADRLIAALSRFSVWRVVSRLSALALARREIAPPIAASALGADYVLSGTCQAGDGAIAIELRLLDAKSGETIWDQAYRRSLVELLASDSDMLHNIGLGVSRAILNREIVGVQGLSIESLPGYALLLDAVRRMHRLSSDERTLSFGALGHLSERHPRSADVHAWMAKWHFLRVAQVDGHAAPTEITNAREHLDRALELEPNHGMSQALRGHLMAFADGNADAARSNLQNAVDQDAGEPLGWLFLSHALAMQGAGAEAVSAVNQGDLLSPLDPLRYFVEMFKATAYLANGDYERANEHATRSCQQNALHLPGLAVLIIAQQLAGHETSAKASARRYLALRPSASVRRFISNHPTPSSNIAQLSSQALRDAGLPM
jgi:adenylate cyclase